jgi:hypothetical protein
MRLRDNGRLNRLRSIAACLLLAEAVAGCATGPYLPPSQAQALLRIMGGMSREEVVSQLGAPHRQETVGKTEFLFYRTDWRTATESEKFSPVAIVDGKVVGLGRVYYQDAVKTEQKRSATAATQT